MNFTPYNPDREVFRSRQNLPHWHQDGGTYFVTSRLADSMPRAVMEEWESARSKWVKDHGIATVDDLRRLPQKEQHEFHRTFTKKWHDFLDTGYGECALAVPKIAEIVVEQFVTGNGDRYHLDAWVLMPNHFHALVRPVEGNSLSKVIQQWKGASARFANFELGRSGKFWMDEPFDHIVRSIDQLGHFRRYIAENPRQAGLREDEYAIGFGSDKISPEKLFKNSSSMTQCDRDFSP